MRALVAADVMSPDVLTVRADMTVPKLATFLLDNEVSGAVVKGTGGRPVGVVSMTDIAAAAEGDSDEVEESAGFYEPRRRPQADVQPIARDLATLTVGDIMTTTLHSVDSGTSVSEVAEMLLDLHLHRLLVIDDDKLVGIISTSDLIGLLIDSP